MDSIYIQICNIINILSYKKVIIAVEKLHLFLQQVKAELNKSEFVINRNNAPVIIKMYIIYCVHKMAQNYTSGSLVVGFEMT